MATGGYLPTQYADDKLYSSQKYLDEIYGNENLYLDPDTLKVPGLTQADYEAVEAETTQAFIDVEQMLLRLGEKSDSDYDINDKLDPLTQANNFGYYDMPMAVKIAAALPGAIGTTGKITAGMITHNNTQSVQAARKAAGLEPMELNGFGFPSNKEDKQKVKNGVVGDVTIGDQNYTIGLKAVGPQGQTMLTPDEARKRAAVSPTGITELNKHQVAARYEDLKRDPQLAAMNRGPLAPVRDVIQSTLGGLLPARQVQTTQQPAVKEGLITDAVKKGLGIPADQKILPGLYDKVIKPQEAPPTPLAAAPRTPVTTGALAEPTPRQATPLGAAPTTQVSSQTLAPAEPSIQQTQYSAPVTSVTGSPLSPATAPSPTVSAAREAVVREDPAQAVKDTVFGGPQSLDPSNRAPGLGGIVSPETEARAAQQLGSQIQQDLGTTQVRGVGFQNPSVTPATSGLGPNRPNVPSSGIQNAIGRVVEDTLGPGHSVSLSSGMEDPGEQYGSARHRTGLAADFGVYDPQGVKVTDVGKLNSVVEGLAAAGFSGLGFGEGYMGANIHADMVDPDNPKAWGARGTWSTMDPGLRARVMENMQTVQTQRSLLDTPMQDRPVPTERPTLDNSIQGQQRAIERSPALLSPDLAREQQAPQKSWEEHLAGTKLGSLISDAAMTPGPLSPAEGYGLPDTAAVSASVPAGPMSPSSFRAMGLGSQYNQAQQDAMMATLAGELSPKTLEGIAKGDQEAIDEGMSVLDTINNRAMADRNVAKTDPVAGALGMDNLNQIGQVNSPYDALDPSNFSRTAGNYNLYEGPLRGLVDSYTTGGVTSPAPEATHYARTDPAFNKQGQEVYGGIQSVSWAQTPSFQATATPAGEHTFGVADKSFKSGAGYGSAYGPASVGQPANIGKTAEPIDTDNQLSKGLGLGGGYLSPSNVGQTSQPSGKGLAMADPTSEVSAFSAPSLGTGISNVSTPSAVSKSDKSSLDKAKEADSKTSTKDDTAKSTDTSSSRGGDSDSRNQSGGFGSQASKGTSQSSGGDKDGQSQSDKAKSGGTGLY